MTLYFKDGTNSGTVFANGVGFAVNVYDAAILDVIDSGRVVLGGTPLSNLEYYTVA